MIGGRARACEDRRDAADGPGLRGVRVQDLRPLLPDQPREPDRRDEVAERRDLPAELVDLHDLDVPRCRDERHRVLAARERAGDEHRVVAPLPQSLREIRDVQRRPAHVQAGDHAQDFDRVRPVATIASAVSSSPAARSTRGS